MPRKVLPLRDWLPDQADLGNLAITAKNVIPWKEGYKSFPSLEVQSANAMNARFQGGTFAKDVAGNTLVFSGDASKLYKYGTVSFSDITRTTITASVTVLDGYATANSDWWEFIVFGSNVIAVNGTDEPQKFTIGTSSRFADLGGSPPIAKHIAVVRDFVVLGNIDEGSGFLPYRVRWSAINNAESWAVSAATQADYQDMNAEFGAVQRIVGGEFGLVIQERAITRMTYVGSPVIFQFDVIELNRGSFAPQSVVAWGNRVWFASEEGFFEVVGGSPAQQIGEGKVDSYFLGDLDRSAAYRITATVDPISNLVKWSYPGAGASSSTPNRILIYHWLYRKWAYADQEIEGFLVKYASPGFTLDDLDNISSSIDSMTTSFDSATWAGGQQSVAAFNTSHKLAAFTGTAMNALVDTGEFQLTPGRTSYVTYVRPLVDGNTSEVSVGARGRLSAAHSFGTAVPTNTDGACFVRSHARYHRFRVATEGAFNFIQGVEVDWQPGNERSDGSATAWDTTPTETLWDVT